MINILESSCFSFSKSSEQLNQDSMLPVRKVSEGIIFGVADGLGAYKGAEKASSIATCYLEKLKNKEETLNFEKVFSDILKEIMDISIANKDYVNASTTLTYCFIDNAGIYIGHIGDCRLYMKSSNKLIQMTKDHTKHQKYLDDKLFTKSQLKNVRGKNVITTAISQIAPMNYENYFIPYDELHVDTKNNISLYIMSDGMYHFWEKIPRFSEQTMDSVVRFGSSLQRRVQRYGAIDDYTFIGCKFNVIR